MFGNVRIVTSIAKNALTIPICIVPNVIQNSKGFWSKLNVFLSAQVTNIKTQRIKPVRNVTQLVVSVQMDIPLIVLLVSNVSLAFH